MAYQKITETKYFQHLDDIQLGQVVKLVGIEEDEDMILFHFSDGTKCNTDFIAPLNDMNAFKNKNVMVEVSSPNNIWTFKDEVVVPKNKTAIDKDGQEWVIPDPYYDPKGTNGPNKEVKKKVGIPPRIEKKKEMISKLSKFGFEVDTPKEEPIIEEIFEEETPKFDFDGTAKILPETEDIKPAVIAQKENVMPAYISLAPIEGGTWEANINTIKDICLSDGTNKKTFNTAQLFYGNGTIVKEGEPEKEEKLSSLDSSDPIYILLDKCKKKQATCDLNLNLMLPGKSIYNLIEDEYDEEDKEKFFEFIISQLDLEELKKALKESLQKAYCPNKQES